MTARALLAESSVSTRERKAVMDSALLINAVMIFAAVMIAWFYRLLEIDVSRLAWMFFTYSAFQLLGSLATDQLRSTRALTAWIVFSSTASILFLAVVWFFAGGVKNPMFLASMFVPVIVAGTLQTRLAISLAVLSVAAALVAAAAQSAELLWTMERIGIRIPWLGSASIPGRTDPLPGVEVTPSSVLLVLLLFGLAQLAFALLSHSVARRMLVLSERLFASSSQSSYGANVSQASILAEPWPTVIVYSDSGQIQQASRSFLNQMLVPSEELAGKTLYDVISFDQAGVVREMIKTGGTKSLSYRIGPERRVAEASVHVFHSEGDTFAAVRLNEVPLPEHEMKPDKQDVALSEPSELRKRFGVLRPEK